MGTRKDVLNKRQLSIIDETDYFSDEGHSQGFGKIEASNRIFPMLDMSHLSLSPKWGLCRTGSCANVYDISCMGSACGDHHSNGINYLNIINPNRSQSHCQPDKESIPLVFLMNGESSSQPHDIHNEASEIKTFDDENVNNGCALVNKARDCFQRRDDSSLPCGLERKAVYKSVITNAYSKPASNHDNNIHAKNDIEINSKSGNIDSSKGVQVSNMDNIHEMFQVLIKCIEGTQNEKQNHYTAAEYEESCKNSPLFYLMEEKVEKPPQDVGNIISSFKEKFSHPNANRIPIRPKSRRSRDLDKRVDKTNLTAKTKFLLQNQDFRDIKGKKMCLMRYNTIQKDNNMYPKESAIVNKRKDNIKPGKKEIVIQRSTTDNVILVKDFQKDQSEYKDCVNSTGEELLKPIASEAGSSLTESLCYGVHSCRNDCCKCGSHPNVIPEKKKNQSKSTGPETTRILDIPDSKGDMKSVVPSGDNVASGCSPQGKQGECILYDKKQHSMCKGEMNRTTYKESNDSSMSCKSPQYKQENNHKTEKLLIPIFKRDGPKLYEDDEKVDFWIDLENENGIANKKNSFSGAKSQTNFLTVPKAIHVPVNFLPPASRQEKNPEEKQTCNVSELQRSTLINGILSSPNNFPNQAGKHITFLNSNGSIARRPMLRHVSQPNMNAHGISQLASASGSLSQAENSPNSQSAEGKFQTKNLNTDLAKLKATAERLKLVTRRPSYLEWLEERKKNRASLDILGIGPANASNVKTPESMGRATFIVGDSKLERVKEKCKSFGLLNSSSTKRHCSGTLRFDACTKERSSKQSNCSSEGSSCGCYNSNTDIEKTDDNVFEESERNSTCFIGVIDGATVPDTCKRYAPDKTSNPELHMTPMWNMHVDKDRVITEARKERIDKSLEWLRNELKCMRSQDQALAKQLLSLRHEMHKLRLSWSCQEHRDLLDEVQCDLEDIQEFSKVLDLPSTVYLDTPLKNVGVTKLNISTRRFSTC